MRIAIVTSAATSMMYGRLYPCDPLLEWLAGHLEDVPPEFREFVPEAHALVRPAMQRLCMPCMKVRASHPTLADSSRITKAANR
jgi:hypothetical protein